MRIREKRRRADALAVFLLAALGLCALVAGGAYAAAQLAQADDRLGQPASDLNAVERLALTVYLTSRAADLAAPAGADAAPRSFSVASGETAAAVAARLADQGLVNDARLLDFYLRYAGLDDDVEAGDFILRQTMSIPEVARALTDASARELAIRLPEGWRREQIAEMLAANPDLNIPADAWLGLTGPEGWRPGAYALYADLPPGASLEGFLMPDTYLLRPGSSAADLLEKVLAAFDAAATPDYRARLAARGLTLYQAVIIASLIEREAAVDDERPLIASVILNRLAIGQALEIDATVQYAVGAAGNWWPPVQGLDFRVIASPFNTYYITGLPVAPIASPRRASLAAVADAAQTDYLFYRALCDGSRRHAFARTYDEHLANACP